MSNKKTEIVYRYLLNYIDEQRFSERHRLPSETALSNRLKVSRDTVRNALSLLEQDKLIIKVRGSGTYINRVRTDHLTLADGKSDYKIGLILQGQDKVANSQLLKGVESSFAGKEIDLKIFFTDNKVSNERKCLDTVILQNFDGFIIDGVKASLYNPNIECYQEFYKRKIPIIFYNNYYKELDYPRVLNNDIQSAEQLVGTLVSAGHRKLCAFFVVDNFQSVEKFQGYVKALHRYGLEFKDEDIKWFFSDDVKDKNFSKKLLSCLKRIRDCTALVCCNQLILRALLSLCKNQELHIPDDYSVVCFDYSFTENDGTEITGSLNRDYEIGQIAGRRLLNMIQEKQFCGERFSYMLSPILKMGSSIKSR